MKKYAPPLQLIIARAMLALAFLGVQHTAALHWLSHSVEATRPAPDDTGKGAAGAHHCDACLAFGALGAAATGSPLLVAAVPLPHTMASAADVDASPAATRLAFRSRAPPLLS